MPGAFFALGLAALVLGMADRYTGGAPFLIGFLMLIPCGVIALLGAYVRRGFAKALDAEGVSAALGRKFQWSRLYYVDHVTKYTRAGRVSHRVKDNQLELVFEGGKVIIIPPLIHDRAAVWNLINSMPVEVRDDGVLRSAPDHPSRESQNGTREELAAFLNSLDAPRSSSE